MKALKQFRGFVLGAVAAVTAMSLAFAVFAAMEGASITVLRGGIGVFLHGGKISMKDANGADVEPFIYDGTTYVPIRAVSEAFGKIVEWDGGFKRVVILDTEIDRFWYRLVDIPDNPDLDIRLYWRHIDGETVQKVDGLVRQYGVTALFKGLASLNPYSQYFCINKLVELCYNNDDMRLHALSEITPFLDSANETIRGGAEFAVSVLGKKFDSPYVLHCAGGAKVFALFNGYSDYGSYNELFVVEGGALSSLRAFSGENSQYIESVELSPGRDRLAVKTSTRRSNSLYIIDLKSREASPEVMLMALEKTAGEHKNYGHTYLNGEYSFFGDLKWADDDTVEFTAELAFDYMETIERAAVRYSFPDNSLTMESVP